MRSFLLLPLLLLGIFATSCKKEELVVPNRTVIADINPNDWAFDNTTKTYVATIRMPEIDDRVNSTNGIIVAISGDNGGGYEALPDVYNGISYVYTYQARAFDDGSGAVYIEAQNINGTPSERPGKALRVKIVIVASEPV